MESRRCTMANASLGFSTIAHEAFLAGETENDESTSQEGGQQRSRRRYKVR